LDCVSVGRRIILNRILKKKDQKAWSRFIWQRVLVNAVILFPIKCEKLCD
jgi:hypothetical protein